MTTLADINKTLEQQNVVLKETRADIHFISFAMNEQLRIIRNQEADRREMQMDMLEANAERQRETTQKLREKDYEIEEPRKAMFDGLFGGLFDSLQGAVTTALGALGLSSLVRAQGDVKNKRGFGSTMLRGGLAYLFYPEIEKLGALVGEAIGDAISIDDAKVQNDINNSLAVGIGAGVVAGPLAGAVSALLSLGLNSLVDEQGNLKFDIPGLDREMENKIADIISTPIVQGALGIAITSLLGPMLKTMFTAIGAVLLSPVGLIAVGGAVSAAAIIYFQEEIGKMIEFVMEPVMKFIGNYIFKPIYDALSFVNNFVGGMTEEQLMQDPVYAALDAEQKNLGANLDKEQQDLQLRRANLNELARSGALTPEALAEQGRILSDEEAALKERRLNLTTRGIELGEQKKARENLLTKNKLEKLEQNAKNAINAMNPAVPPDEFEQLNFLSSGFMNTQPNLNIQTKSREEISAKMGEAVGNAIEKVLQEQEATRGGLNMTPIVNAPVVQDYSQNGQMFLNNAPTGALDLNDQSGSFWKQSDN